jgi:hypothetical protein
MAPSVLSATRVIVGRLRDGLSPLAERDDALLTMVEALVGDHQRAMGVTSAVGVAHGAAAIVLASMDGAATITVSAAIAAADVAILRSLFDVTGRPVQSARPRTVKGPVDRTPRPWNPLELPGIEPERLARGVWTRRAELVWVRRGVRVPRHLLRTRIVPWRRATGLTGALWTRLLSWTVRRRTTISSEGCPEVGSGCDVLVSARDGRRIMYIDVAAAQVTHRSDVRLHSRAQLDAYAETFRYLRGPRIIAAERDEELTEELIDGLHLADLDEATRLGALATLLSDVMALTHHTSRPASAEFKEAMPARRRSFEREIPLGLRTVVAPSTTSLDNVVLVGPQRIAWVEAWPLVECSFHLPWYGVALRLADISPAVRTALEGGAFDHSVAHLLSLGGIGPRPGERPLETLRRLPWGRVPIAEAGGRPISGAHAQSVPFQPNHPGPMVNG